MLESIQCVVNHPEEFTYDLKFLLNFYKERHGFKEYYDTEFNYKLLEYFFYNNRHGVYNTQNVSSDLLVQLAFLTYVIDCVLPFNPDPTKKMHPFKSTPNLDDFIRFVQLYNPNSTETLIKHYGAKIARTRFADPDWYTFEALFALKLRYILQVRGQPDTVPVIPAFTQETRVRVSNIRPGVCQRRVREREPTIEEEEPHRKRRKSFNSSPNSLEACDYSPIHLNKTLLPYELVLPTITPEESAMVHEVAQCIERHNTIYETLKTRTEDWTDSVEDSNSAVISREAYRANIQVGFDILKQLTSDREKLFHAINEFPLGIQCTASVLGYVTLFESQGQLIRKLIEQLKSQMISFERVLETTNECSVQHSQVFIPRLSLFARENSTSVGHIDELASPLDPCS